MRMTKMAINFEEDSFQEVTDTSLKALAEKCKSLENVEGIIERTEEALKKI